MTPARSNETTTDNAREGNSNSPDSPRGISRKDVLSSSAKLGIGVTAVGVLGHAAASPAMAVSTPHASPPSLTAAGKARLQAVLKRAAQDITFREALLQNPEQALKGTNLTAAEIKVVGDLHRVRIEEYGIDVRKFRSFLRDNGTKRPALTYAIDYYEQLPKLASLGISTADWSQLPGNTHGLGLATLTVGPAGTVPTLPSQGSTINVSGISPPGFNGTFVVVSSNGNEIQYVVASPGPYRNGGKVQFDSRGDSCF